MPYPRRSRKCEDCIQASAIPKLRKRKGGCLTHRNHQLLTTIRCLSTVIFNVNCMHTIAIACGRSVTLTSPGQPGLSFVRACMTHQCITSWGLSSNGIINLCRTSWHMPSTRRDPPEGWVCPLVYIYEEGLSRTVVPDLLPPATAHGHQTFPDYGRHTRSQSKGGDVREKTPA